MAGTMISTFSKAGAEQDVLPQNGTIKIVLAWTSNSSGAVDQTTARFITGILDRVVFVPGGGGSQPTDAYDVTLLDPYGIDVLSGQGANLSNALTTEKTPLMSGTDGTTTAVIPRVLSDQLELIIVNAGNAKSGTIVLYVRE